jgi:hypothetical protein
MMSFSRGRPSIAEERSDEEGNTRKDIFSSSSKLAGGFKRFNPLNN